MQAGSEGTPGYRLRQLLGRGGYGEVWEAEEASTGNVVALKYMQCGNSAAASKEIRSIQAIRQLSHPNLIRIDQVWCQPGYIVVAMEKADGSLEDLLQVYLEEMKTPIVPEQVCMYLTDAAEALDFLNTRKHLLDGKRVTFQHCDVKPSNFLLMGETVKLCDFGLASQMTSAHAPHQKAGTLDYAAPEVFQGRLSNTTDQYSLAITYCRLRGGRLPFTDTPSTFTKSYLRPVPDLSMLSDEERPFIARALDSVPQHRWPTCAELMKQLSGLLM